MELKASSIETAIPLSNGMWIHKMELKAQRAWVDGWGISERIHKMELKA